MSLANQALEYWQTCQRYRGSYSQLARTHAAHVEVPSLYIKSTNPHIQTQLYNIMVTEDIEVQELG